MKLYLKILHFVKPYKIVVIISIIFSILFVIMNAFSLWLISSLLSTIMQSEKVIEIPQIVNSTSVINKLEYYAYQLLGSENQVNQLKTLCIFLFGSFFINNHYMYLPLSFFDKNKSGELSSIMIRDVAAMKVAFTESVKHLINSPISVFVLLSMLLVISIKMTLITFIIIPISGFIIVNIGRSIRRKAKRSSIQIAGIMNILNETITGIRIVKAFTMEKFENSRFKIENSKFYNLTYRQAKLTLITTPINDMIGVSIAVILLWIGGIEVLITGSLTSENFIRYIIFLFAMMDPIKKLSNVNNKIQAGLASAERVFKVMDNQSDIVDLANPVDLKKFNEKIVFFNVYFKYDQSNKPILSDINLNINKGEMVAVVGTSGAGKTTLVDLLPRFYDINQGKITIDKIDIRKISLYSLRSLIGIVNQDTILFNDTIFNNISYGLKNANLKQIKIASEAANALGFIEQLPNRFNTIIGELGARLSGGQKQRISIARAILKNPSILILDEATSSLDTESERKVQEAINNLVKNRTVIVIAHRLSTIANANKIIVMEKGNVLDIGKHDDLINKNVVYKKLYNLQFKEKL